MTALARRSFFTLAYEVDADQRVAAYIDCARSSLVATTTYSKVSLTGCNGVKAGYLIHSRLTTNHKTISPFDYSNQYPPATQTGTGL